MPCLTVMGALGKAVAGNVVYVYAGTYPENVVINAPNNLTLVGAGGTVEIAPASGTGVYITAAGVTLQNLTVSSDGISVNSGNTAAFTNVTSNGNASGIYVTGSGTSITGSDSSFTGADSGVTINSGGTLTLTNVTASGITLYGIAVYSSTAVLTNVTATGNLSGFYSTGPDVTLSGGSFSGTNYGIYLNTATVATITNTSASGGQGLRVGFSSSVTVTGGSFTGTTNFGVYVIGTVPDISNASINGVTYAIGCSATESVTSLSPGTNTCTGGSGLISGCTLFPNADGVCPSPLTCHVATCSPGTVLVSCQGSGCFQGRDNTPTCVAQSPYTGSNGSLPGRMIVEWHGAGGAGTWTCFEEYTAAGGWVRIPPCALAGGAMRNELYIPGTREGVRIVCQ